MQKLNNDFYQTVCRNFQYKYRMKLKFYPKCYKVVWDCIDNENDNIIQYDYDDVMIELEDYIENIKDYQRMKCFVNTPIWKILIKTNKRI